MKIDKDQIAETFIAGKTKDGKNIVYVATHGGLHAFFCKDEDGNVSSIGAAPHKAIARFLAEKKEPGIKWNEDFNKSEDLQKMGLKGDWKKEGYKIFYGKPYSDHLGTVHTIHVIPPKVKNFNPEIDDGAAWFQINELNHPKHGRHLQVSDAQVLPEHRRKGIASAVYKKVQKDTGLKIIPFQDEQTEDAKALWSQPNRPFGKSEDETFQQLRKFMFAEAPLQKNEPSDIFVVYDVNKQEISFMKKEEIIEGIKNKTLSKYVLARDLACNIDATCIAHIPDFEGAE